MNSRERITVSIRLEQPDRIPIGEITVPDGLICSFFNKSRICFNERYNFLKQMDIDALCIEPDYGDYCGNRFPLLGNVKWIDLEKWSLMADRFLFATLSGAFGWGIRAMGFIDFLKAVHQQSSEIYDIIMDVERFNIDLASRAVVQGADGILIADDISHCHATIIDPLMLKKLFFPSLARQVEQIAKFNIPVFFHSDGNLNLIFNDIVEIGFQGLHCLDSNSQMRLADLKASYGKKICLWGNLDANYLFSVEKTHEIVERVNDILDSAASGGGFIFGSSSGLAEGMLIKNIRIAFKTVLHDTRYGALPQPHSQSSGKKLFT